MEKNYNEHPLKDEKRRATIGGFAKNDQDPTSLTPE